jgi:hypothetical protein
MNQVLMNYLPNAFAFIYVIDITRAGGLQKNFKEKVSRLIRELPHQHPNDICTTIINNEGGICEILHISNTSTCP